MKITKEKIKEMKRKNYMEDMEDMEKIIFSFFVKVILICTFLLGIINLLILFKVGV